VHYIDTIAAARRQVASLDDLARLDSPVHRLDSRVKVLVTLAFVATAVSYPKYALSAMTPLALYPAVVIGLARLPVDKLARWLLPALPLVLLIGAANPFLDRRPVGEIAGLVVTGGWLSYASIAFRLLLTVLAGLLLIATTGINDICCALGRLGVPRVVTTQMLLMYRYLFVLIDEAGRVVRAHALRAAGHAPSLRLAGPLGGRLLLRALDRAQRIHLAMLCRGFDGRMPRTATPHAPGARDVFWIVGWCGLLIVARGFDLPLWLGHALTGGGS
jgi:cobalt/nickel transport system permease protein